MVCVVYYDSVASSSISEFPMECEIFTLGVKGSAGIKENCVGIHLKVAGLNNRRKVLLGRIIHCELYPGLAGQV